MKQLFLVRHGDYFNDNLTPFGVNQIEMTARAISFIVYDYQRPCVISSTAPRATQAADIITKAFGLEAFVKDKLFWLEYDDPLEPAKMREFDSFIQPYADKNETIILVSHEGIIFSYSNYLIQTRLGKSGNIRRPRLSEFAYINFDSAEYWMAG